MTVQQVRLGEELNFRNGQSSPERNDGAQFAVFGSNGLIGRADLANTESECVIIGRVGSYCGSLQFAPYASWVTENAIVCTAKRRDETRFWYYALKSANLGARRGGSGQPLLNQTVLNAISLTVPIPAHRQAIAEVLGALDDKIAADSASAKTLAQLAQAKFDVVSRNASRSVPLATITTTQYGVTKSAAPTGTHGLLRVTDINKAPWITWDTVPFVADLTPADCTKYLVTPGDVLVARMADPGKVGLIEEGDPPAVFASYLVRVCPLNDLDPLYLFHFMRSHEYQSYAASSSSGSVQKNMNAKVIVGTDIPLIGRAEQAAFSREVGPLHELVSQLLRESRTLADLRDTLLPALMDGTIRVKDAVATAEEVL
jgi:type I restriction enzyme, S subunit